MPPDHSGILPAEAELLYINEVERLDGFGQEIFPVKVASAGLAVRHLLRRAQAFGEPVLIVAGRTAWLSLCHVALVGKFRFRY